MAYLPLKAAQVSQVLTNDGGTTDNKVKQGADVAVPAAPTNSRTFTGQNKVMYTDYTAGQMNQNYVDTAYVSRTKGGPQTPNLNP